MRKIINNISDTKEIAIYIKNEIVMNKNEDEDFYILLSGTLGAGKTTFTKELIKLFNIRDNVTSPTFVILNTYSNEEYIINHMDAYRLNKNTDIDIFTESFFKSINIIEWYENIKLDFLNNKYIKINISFDKNNDRVIHIERNYK